MALVTPIPLNHVVSRHNLLQSRVWGVAKRYAGTTPLAFDTPEAGTILVLLRRVDDDTTYATVPWGPEPPPDLRGGTYLEAISEALASHLPQTCIFIRYDLPWVSPWSDDDGKPPLSTRELEINFGTVEHRFRKAPTDVRPVDTLVLDLDRPDDSLKRRMKPKTRYNIGLAQRRGVRVRSASPRELGLWFGMYRRTMERHGKRVHRFDHFSNLFEAVRQSDVADLYPGAPRKRHNVRLLIAEHDRRPLAGMVLAVSGDYAIYLYGASAATERRLMPSYLLQWEAMRTARRLGARRYDLFGIPGDRRPGHPMHGLLRFKEGFGGVRVSRRGCWDFPLDESAYQAFAAREGADRGYHR